VLLVSDDAGAQTIYRIVLVLPNDLIAGINKLLALQDAGLTAKVAYSWRTHEVVRKYVAETTLFVEAFQASSQRSFGRMKKEELHSYLRRFIRFKALTDPRIHGGSNTIPSPLTPSQADRLAADMIAVADFYDFPLDLLIGIGAMENKFMSVAGALQNTKW